MTDDPAGELRRWLDSGGEARRLGTAGADLVVGLFTCDGGEEMGRVVGPADVLEGLLDPP